MDESTKFKVVLVSVLCGSVFCARAFVPRQAGYTCARYFKLGRELQSRNRGRLEVDWILLTAMQGTKFSPPNQHNAVTGRRLAWTEVFSLVN